MISYLNLSSRILALFIISTLLMNLTACKDNDENATPGINQEIESIHFMTENFPPLNYEQDGNIYGVSVDLLEEMFKKMQLNLSREDVTLMDWNEAYQKILTQENTMLFSMARLPERELQFKWVGPIAPGKNNVFALKSGNVTVNEATDLNNYNVGLIEDYAEVTILQEEGVLEESMIFYADVADLYNALISGEVDCIVFSERGNNLIIESLGLNAEEIESVYLVAVTEDYFAFNKNTSDEIIYLFQQKLDEIKNDKTQTGSSLYEQILNNYNVIQHIDDNITEEMAINLVEQTVAGIAADAEGTFKKINKQLPPYKDESNPALYTFVYDTNVSMIAHADNEMLIGKSFKGKPDVAGKMFRDLMVEGALQHEEGWMDYIYTRPGQGGLYYKTTYYHLVTGSDGNLYVVCAGRFK